MTARARRVLTAALMVVWTHGAGLWPVAACAHAAPTIKSLAQTTTQPAHTATPSAASTATAPSQSASAQPAPTTPAAPTPAASSAPLPRVRLVATGGTISNRPQTRRTADELIASIPAVTSYARAEAEQFANLASSELTLDQWLVLSRRINTLFQQEADLAGVVVTSGTDTLEELAYFLHLTVRSDRPVVIVGAMRRPDIPGYEGQANLLAGFRVAADTQSRGRGALVVLNDEILSAREATKTDAQRLDTFQSRCCGVLGVVDVDRVVYYRAVEKRHTAKSEFDVQAITTLPRVDVLLTYQGAPGDLIRASADAGARGIVLATAAGATSGTQGEGVRYAQEKGVAIVQTTRTGAGRIMGGATRAPVLATTPAAPSATPPTTAPGTTAPTNGPAANAPRNAARQIAGEDLAPIKARILLMLALTRTSDPAELQRIFLEY